MKLIYNIYTYVLLVTIFLLQSCGVNSNLMFKQNKGVETSVNVPMKPTEAYKISADDKLSFSLSTNNGAQLIEGISGVSVGPKGANKELVYLVRANGFVELPVLGKVEVAGLTIEDCEDKLVDLFSLEYKEPFAKVKSTKYSASPYKW